MKTSLIQLLILVLLLTSCTANQQNQNNSDNAQSIPTTTTPTAASQSPANNASAASNSNVAPAPTYIPGIVTLDKITSDESLNHQLQITIKNPYDKVATTVQVYIGDNGNLSIPDGTLEDDSHLLNITVNIPAKSEGSYTISTNDKGATDRDYIVSARRIRFTDGTTVNP